WAGASGTTRRPSQRTSSEHSGPSSPSSMTTRRPASPKAPPASLAATSASASSSEVATNTPFPAARPSVFTTQGPGSVRRNRRASSTRSKAPKRAVGTPASSRTSFMNAFDPSSRAPSAPGPTTNRPRARRRSASPSTNGSSGPTTTRSASTSSGGAVVTVTRCPSGVTAAMPGLPGVTTTSALRPSTWARACSRPPLPTTQTVVRDPINQRCRGRGGAYSCGGEGHELLAAGADADQPHRDPDLVGEEGHVVAGRLRQLGAGGGRRQVGPPPRQLLVDRGDLVEGGLVVREVGDPL